MTVKDFLLHRMLDHTSNSATPKQPNQNGLGEDFDAQRPRFRNIDLVRYVSLVMGPHMNLLTLMIRSMTRPSLILEFSNPTYPSKGTTTMP